MVDHVPPSATGAEELTGTALAGRYRLRRLIANGGMAQVWEAEDEVLSRPVAVKLLHPHLASDDSFVTRFRAEAIAAARLAHPAIVSIYDTCNDHGREAIVMELVRGTTLRRLLDERHTLDPAEATAIASHVAEALDAAHRAGLVHRDVKPANILLSDDGRVLVADFGIAKAMAGSDLTQDGLMIGTAKYLAPEQVEGGPVDARTDIYALGIVLYESLCGRVPFQADTDAATALARLHEEPLRPRQVRAGISKPFEQVVLRAMARRPDDRYATAGDLRAALTSAVAVPDEPTLPPGVLDPAGDSYAPPMGPAPQPLADEEPPPTFVQSERRWLLPTLVIVLVAVALGVAGVLLERSDPGRLLDNVTGRRADPPAAVKLVSANIFDPDGDRRENDDLAPRVTDGDPRSAWQTEQYNSPIEDLKDGVGIYVTLDQSTTIRKLKLVSGSSGWDAEVFVTDGPVGADLASWGQPVGRKSSIGTGDVSIDLDAKQGRAVLVWITHLASQDGTRKVVIDEITPQS